MRLFALYFLLLSLLPNFEGFELAKVSGLLSHYAEHSAEPGHSGWLEFLSDHYGNTEHASSGDQDHKKLPFKSHDCSIHSMIAYSQELPGFYFSCPCVVHELKQDERGQLLYFSAPFWQPPRQA